MKNKIILRNVVQNIANICKFNLVLNNSVKLTTV